MSPTDVATKGIDLNGLGSAEVIPIGSIQVDEEYQRELRHDLVNKIGSEYDIVKAGPILVNERDPENNQGDGLWAVDGQHRMAGALQAGETEIFAHVVHGLTRAEEAELRLARNDRRSDNTFEKFRARLVMGDEKAHAIVECVRQQGAKLNLAVSPTHGINALVAAETLYNAGDGAGVWLGRVLRFLRETFGEEHLGGKVVGANMMKAVAWFIDRHPHVRQSELSTRVSNAGMEEIDRQARNHQAINGGALWVNHYRALVAIWNHGRMEQNKIEAKTIGSLAQLGRQGVPAPRRQATSNG